MPSLKWRAGSWNSTRQRRLLESRPYFKKWRELCSGQLDGAYFTDCVALASSGKSQVCISEPGMLDHFRHGDSVRRVCCECLLKQVFHHFWLEIRDVVLECGQDLLELLAAPKLVVLFRVDELEKGVFSAWRVALEGSVEEYGAEEGHAELKYVHLPFVEALTFVSHPLFSRHFVLSGPL